MKTVMNITDLLSLYLLSVAKF